MNRLYADLLAHGAKYGKSLSPKAVRNAHGVLHRALADAVRWEMVVRNVADSADPPRVNASTVTASTAADLGAFLNHTEQDRLHALWLLLATSGMRRGEGLALRWADVDLTAGRVTITRTAAWVGGKVTFSEPKTRAGRRLVPLPAETIAALRDHRKRLLGSEPDLLRRAWRALPAREHHASVRARREAGGFATVTLHALWHTFCTLALGARVPVKVVAELVGHSSTSITSDLYQHVTPTMAEEATSQVANLIGKGRR